MRPRLRVPVGRRETLATAAGPCMVRVSVRVIRVSVRVSMSLRVRVS